MIVAHLADLHACPHGTLAYGRVDTRPFLARAVDRINALVPAVDCTIVAGDVAERGTATEYAVARAELDRLHAPWWPVPGNHDGTAFGAAFADRLPGARPGIGCTVERGGTRFALLDTSVPDAAHGELDAARADWLDGALAHGPTVLVMHHPPFDVGIAHMDRIGLRGRERLAPLLAVHRPLAVLCGHVHRTIHATIEGVPVSIAPSPAHAVAFDLSPDGPADFAMEPPAFLVHRLTGAGIVSHTVFVDAYPGPYPFFPPGRGANVAR